MKIKLICTARGHCEKHGGKRVTGKLKCAGCSFSNGIILSTNKIIKNPLT